MSARILCAVLAVLMGLVSVARAADLLSRPLPAGGGTSAACHIRNTGTTSIPIQVRVFSNNAPVVTSDSCNDAPLAGGRACQVVVDLPDSSYAACSVTAMTVRKLRGTLEIRAKVPRPGARGGLEKVLVAEDLR